MASQANHTPHLLETQLSASWSPAAWCDVGVVAAVSGGADSVGLCRALVRLRSAGVGKLHVAHFNHRLRGNAADADANFVAQLAARLKLEFHLGSADVPPSAEADARAQRYAFLSATAERVGARYVVTAHTADDQAETILHRILRGTGIAGLSGMPRTRPLGAATLLRPMLAVRRELVHDYLGWLGQPIREDATNDDTQYTRNRLRHELLPELTRSYNPQVVEALLQLGSLAADANSIINERIEQLFSKSVAFPKKGRVEIRLSALTDEPASIVRELLRTVWQRQAWPQAAMTFSHWQAMAEMSSADEPRDKRVFPGGVVVERTDDFLRLQRPAGK